MEDDKVQPTIEENKALSKENKNKRSKKWKRKSNRGEGSMLLKKSLENATDNSDLCDNDEGRPNAKERKSFKNRIKKMSIRKSSKADKKNGSRLSDKTEEEVAEREQESSNVAKESQVFEANHDDDGTKADEKLTENPINDEHCADIGEEELEKSNEQDDELEIIRECKEEDKSEPAQVEQDNECKNFMESSSEETKLEEVERRKSRENFDAVIAELVCKEVTLKEEPSENETMHKNESNTQEVTAPRFDLMEAENGGIMNEDSRVANAEHKTTESAVLEDKSSSSVSTGPRPYEEQTANKGVDSQDQSENDDHEQAMKAKKDAGFDNSMENKDKKVFRHINDENMDISQNITKKTVGKVVGRYRQVHLTKTYCQCCSLM